MKKVYSLFGISLLSIAAFGQTNDAGQPVKYCSQHTIQNQLLADPAMAAEYNAAQAQLAAREEAMKTAGTTRGTIYKIPVVFHILHQGGEENVSRAQVLSALAILNRDYRLQNADAAAVHNDFKASNPAATCKPTDVEIEFVLATKAPNGACFSGITRTNSPKTVVTSTDNQGQWGAVRNGNDVYIGDWPANKYLNIIIAKNIGGAAGYTFNPGIGSSTPYNSIFILHNYVGNIGTSSDYNSRALTHEVGHWINLAHTWGSTNDPGESCSGTDNVTDTPQTCGSNLVCNLNENTCGPRANVENYMDYSYCSKMFSAGQVARMRASITSSVSGRNNLITPANLTAVGADGTAGLCAAKFSAERTAVCAGEQITFSDESYNAVTGWTWTFTGGSPASSTSQNPTITYNTPGTYTVKLVATDGSSSDTEEKTAYITVLPAAVSLPFLESFESLSSLTPKWIVNNPGANGAWTLATNTGSSGTKSAKLGNFSQATDNIDELISTPVDLSGVNSTDKVTLSYRYAYRKRATANDDILKVLISNNCGETWDVRKTMTATQMSSTTVTTDWTPTSADFETVHVTNIISTYWIENFRYMFQFTSGGGNNVYLDDINIYEGPPSGTVVAGVDEIAEFQNAVVFPNPADEEVNVRFTAPTGQQVKLAITDLMGKVVQEVVINAAEGSNLVLMPTSGLSSGMYLIRFNDGSQTLNFTVK